MATILAGPLSQLSLGRNFRLVCLYGDAHASHPLQIVFTTEMWCLALREDNKALFLYSRNPTCILRSFCYISVFCPPGVSEIRVNGT